MVKSIKLQDGITFRNQLFSSQAVTRIYSMYRLSVRMGIGV